MIEAKSAGISCQLKDIYFICGCYWNVATYKWKVHNGQLKLSLLWYSFVLNRRSVSIMKCRSRHEVDLAVSVVSFISSLME